MDKLERITKFKTTFYSNIKMLSDLLLFSAIYLFFFFYFKDAIGQNAQIILLVIFTLLFLLPTCIVHYNYYNFSRGYIFSFETDFIKRKGVVDVLILNKNDIEEIIFFMTPNRILRSGLINFPFENYFYCKIKMKSGKSIIITCLISNKLDEILAATYSDVKIKKIKSYIPLITV